MTRTVGDPSTSTTFTVYAEYIMMSSAPFILPKMPDLLGFEDLHRKKHVFHSARWDYEYTGGTQEKPDLEKLRGKRVAIIGTGATAIQIVPELAKWADQVYVVQRTATHVGPRNQAETDPEYWAKMTSEKGWQKKRRLAFDAYVSNSKGYGPDLVNDGWTATPAGSGFLGSKSKLVAPNEVEEHIKDLYTLDLARTESLRKHVDKIVKDKHTAEEILATQKHLFPVWTMKRFNEESFSNPKVYWLQPSVSFEIVNTSESQLDFPLTTMAFIWRSFETVAHIPVSDKDTTMRLLTFYLNRAKPQYITWSLKNLMGLKVRGSVPLEGFTNIKFTRYRGEHMEKE